MNSLKYHAPKTWMDMINLINLYNSKAVNRPSHPPYPPPQPTPLPQKTKPPQNQHNHQQTVCFNLGLIVEERRRKKKKKKQKKKTPGLHSTMILYSAVMRKVSSFLSSSSLMKTRTSERPGWVTGEKRRPMACEAPPSSSSRDSLNCTRSGRSVSTCVPL